MIGHAHLEIDKLARLKFSGEVTFVFEAGRLVRYSKREVVEIGPRPGVWPPANREMRTAPLSDPALAEAGKEPR